MGGASRGRWKKAAAALSALVLLALAALAGLADAERAQQGNLVVSLSGGVSPRKLPRHRPAPVAVTLAGELRTADGSPLPQLERVELALAGGGELETRGLPTCRRAQLTSISPGDALAACGPALVGLGHLDLEIFIAGQPPFAFHASLRAFNGRLGDGRRVVWLQVYGPEPPIALVLALVVEHRPGAFHTALVATLPPGVGASPHLARFQMTLGRRYRYHGALHSYLNGSCPVPRRFTAGFFPLARATYAFLEGQTISATIVRGCRVRG